MKISMTGGVLDLGKSGIGVYITCLMKALVGQSNANTFHFFGKKDELPLFNQSPSLHLHAINSWAEKPLGNLLWQNSVLVQNLREFDLLHVPTIRRIPLIKSCPMVVTVHDMAAFKINSKYGWARGIYHHQILKRLIHRADRVIAVSYNTKKDLIELTGYPEEKIQVIYPGVKQLIHPEKAKRTPTLVYVSRIEHPGKNHLRLIEAFERFKKRCGAPHQLLLVGQEWSGAEVVKSRASKDVIFKGYLPEEQVAKLYSTCAAMVYPSLYEGFGMPVIEAMAAGAAVVCSNNSSLKEIAEGKAILIDPEDVESIAEGIEKALEPAFQKQAAVQGPLWAAQFTWEKAAEQTLQVYDEVVNEH